jgi:hypothetical protein
MAWTNKVATVVKGRINSGASTIKGYVDGVAGSLTDQVSQFTSAFSGMASADAAKAKAKNILSSSPLEIGSGGAVQKDINLYGRYNYGTVYYPQETSNLDEGHYVIIDIVQHDKSSFNAPGERKVESSIDDAGTAQNQQKSLERQTKLRSMNSGINQKMGHTHNRISDSVCIYTPAEALKFKYTANYEALSTGLAGFFGSAMEAGKEMSLKEAIMDGGGAALERVLGEAVTGIVSAIPGVGDIRGAIDKSMGRAINPFNEQVFRSVPFREFQFPFIFAPKNRNEVESVQKIITLFKFHMLPEFSNKTQSAFLSPSEFQITYMYRTKNNTYIPHIARCVMTNMEVDYANDGAFHTFREDDKGAAPVITSMNCTFAETEIMTKELIGLGY